MGIADLSGPRAKLGRADEHKRIIDSELELLTQERAESKSLTFGRDGPWYTVNFGPILPLPPRLALIVGDYLTNLRAALDHLVWQLVLREDQKPGDHHQFPICKTPGEFMKRVKEPKNRNRLPPLDGIPVDGDAWTIIEQAQPFNSREPEEHPLFQVMKLNNIDKHRTLLLQRAVVDGQTLVMGVAWEPHLNPVESIVNMEYVSAERPTEVARFRFAGEADLRMYMKGHYVIEPTVNNGEHYVRLAILDSACERVQQVLDQVAALPRVQA